MSSAMPTRSPRLFARGCCDWQRLEVHLHAQLVPARVRHHVSRLTEVRVGSVADIEIAEVVPVEGVEDVESDAICCPRPCKAREVLSQTEIQIPIRERPWHLETAPLILIAR